MNSLPWIATALAAMMVSGCITLEETPPADAPASDTATRSEDAGASRATTAARSGTMTASETTQVTTGLCTGGADSSLLPAASQCATKTHWIEGTIGLDRLPIDFSSFNGNVEVQGGTGGTWNLTATLRARGDTEAAARSNLDNIQFTWSHESAGSHHLKAEAKKKNPVLNNQESARFTLHIPAAVVLKLTAATTNGDATARGIQADTVRLTTTNGRVVAHDLEAQSVILGSTNGAGQVTTVSADTIEVTTSNGAITVTAAARDYRLKTSNGAIDAKLRPSASGDVTIGTTNGPVSVSLVEDASHGHDVSATTTNGMVTISLEDGETSGSSTSKTFKTTDYSKRSIQTKTRITSTNSMVQVSGA